MVYFYNVIKIDKNNFVSDYCLCNTITEALHNFDSYKKAPDVEPTDKFKIRIFDHNMNYIKDYEVAENE